MDRGRPGLGRETIQLIVQPGCFYEVQGALLEKQNSYAGIDFNFPEKLQGGGGRGEYRACRGPVPKLGLQHPDQTAQSLL